MYNYFALQFFLIPCSNVYMQIDECNLEMQYLENQLKTLVDSANTFSLAAPSKIELTMCRSDIKLLKVNKIKTKKKN